MFGCWRNARQHGDPTTCHDVAYQEEVPFKVGERLALEEETPSLVPRDDYNVILQSTWLASSIETRRHACPTSRTRNRNHEPGNRCSVFAR